MNRKKYSIDDLKTYAKGKCGNCLSAYYGRHGEKYEWRCAEGHQWEASWQNVKHRKSWCPVCTGRRQIIEGLKAHAKSKGGECLSAKYRGAAGKYKWRCAEGHEWAASWQGVKQGCWCPVCAGRKPTIEDLKAHAKSRGGECLSAEYSRYDDKYSWRCAEGHQWEASWNKVKRGSWCPVCTGQCQTIDDLKAYAQNMGGNCLSEEYRNLTTKYRWRCAEGHEWAASWQGVKQGCWCPRCLKKGESVVLGIVERLMETLSTSGVPSWLKKRLKKNDRRILVDGWFEEAGLVVERNGKQHYSYTPCFHRNGEADLIRQIERDQKLADVCVTSKQFLLVVPFTDGDLYSEREKPMSEAATLALIENLARKQCLPFPINPEFREMMVAETD